MTEQDKKLSDAIENGNIEEVKSLLGSWFSKPDVNAISKYERPALENAIYFKNYEIAKVLIENGSDVNNMHKNTTPLMLVIENELPNNFVKLLLENGANPNKCHDDGYSPLMDAASNGSLEIVKLLVKHGANLSLEDESGCNVLYYSYKSTDIFKYLLSNGMKITNHADKKTGRTLLANAALHNQEFIVKTFVEAGADVNSVDSMGNTALSFAVGNDNFEMVQYLIEKGARVTDMAMVEYYKYNPQLFKLLLSNGGNINARYEDGRTILLLRASTGQLDLFKQLIQSGADLDAKDNEGNDVYYYAERNEDIKNYLNEFKSIQKE